MPEHVTAAKYLLIATCGECPFCVTGHYGHGVDCHYLGVTTTVDAEPFKTDPKCPMREHGSLILTIPTISTEGPHSSTKPAPTSEVAPERDTDQDWAYRVRNWLDCAAQNSGGDESKLSVSFLDRACHDLARWAPKPAEPEPEPASGEVCGECGGSHLSTEAPADGRGPAPCKACSVRNGTGKEV